jgi:predicted amidohydrolase YtcJ
MPSLLIHNARLHSFHDGFGNDNYDSIVVEDGIIKAVGKETDLQTYIQSGIPLLNARGCTVLPGFNDSHIHIWKVGNLKTFMIDVRSAKSLEEMLSILSDFHLQHPELRWIIARGFNETSWPEAVMPTKKDLDKVTRNKPIYVIHTSAHKAVANSKALELASVDVKTKMPQGGEMQVGEDGQPNGIFSETAMGLINSHIPAYTKEELKTMVRSARDEMYSYGITSATDPAVDPLLMNAYHEMNSDQDLGFRLHAIPILLPDGSEQPYPVPDFFSSPFLNLNTVKFFSDGGLSSQTAALKRPYNNSSDHGILRLKKSEYLALCRSSIDKGLGIATHAIGDAAIDLVIDVYKALSKAGSGILNRIEHLGLPSEKNLDDMANYNMATSMQAIFIHELGRNFIRYLDKEYLENCYPIKSVLQKGILMALSSDAPVVRNFNPLKGMESAINRSDQDGNIIAPQEAITISEALKAYTIDAARISRAEDVGSLQPGRLADLIMLDGDPLNTVPDQLTEIKVLKTFVGGSLVWERTI